MILLHNTGVSYAPGTLLGTLLLERTLLRARPHLIVLADASRPPDEDQHVMPLSLFPNSVFYNLQLLLATSLARQVPLNTLEEMSGCVASSLPTSRLRID